MSAVRGTDGLAGRVVSAVLLALALGAAGGCHALEPCPPSVTRALGVIDENPAMVQVRVYFATDREPTGLAEPESVFGAQRSRELTLGKAYVNIPPGHSRGVVERPVLPWETLDPNEHIFATRMERFGVSRDEDAQQSFKDSIDEVIEGSTSRQVLIFVHGYATPFDVALREAAQIAHDIRFDGVPILYSWSSSGDVFGYLIDGTNAEWTAPYFARFLEIIRDETAAESVNIVGHSVGVRVISRGVRDYVASRYRIPLSAAVEPNSPLDQIKPPGESYAFEQIILTAADIDAEIFERDFVPYLLWAARRTTIYASARDRALGLSGRLNGYDRLGQTDLPNVDIEALKRIEVVDVTEFDYDWWNHAYHAHVPQVLADMRGVLAGEEPGERGLRRQFVYRLQPHRAGAALSP